MMEQSFNLQKKIALGLSAGRTLNYTLQSLWLPLIDRVLNGKTERDFTQFKNHLKVAAPKIQKLINADAENVARQIYPSRVLIDEKVFFDWLQLPKVIADSVRANKQRKAKKNSLFDKEAQIFSREMPDYYQRNFHFQKNGYLSDDSADIYEQQVEILFSGTAQMMRRQIIKPLKNHFKGSHGEGLKILEIGSGTGSLTKALSLAFPQAQITCLDLSPHYLKKARRQFKGSNMINFIQGFGENLPFKDGCFDAVVSCYLFHELPEDIREQVIFEKWRVLKNHGFLGIVDSIQNGDDDDLQFALDQFPVNFHEPFYKNYVNKDLAATIKKVLNVASSSEIHFLTKLVFARKNF